MSELSTIGKIMWLLKSATEIKCGLNLDPEEVVELLGHIKNLEESYGLSDQENKALLSRAEKAEAKVAELEDENKSIRHLLSLWKKTEAMKEIERLRSYLKVIENEAPKRNVDWCRRIAKEVLGDE